MTTSEYPMAELCRAAAARFARRLRTHHEASGCPTWERYTYEHANVVDGQPIGGWGCRHHIFTTAEEG